MLPPPPSLKLQRCQSWSCCCHFATVSSQCHGRKPAGEALTEAQRERKQNLGGAALQLHLKPPPPNLWAICFCEPVGGRAQPVRLKSRSQGGRPWQGSQGGARHRALSLWGCEASCGVTPGSEALRDISAGGLPALEGLSLGTHPSPAPPPSPFLSRALLAVSQLRNTACEARPHFFPGLKNHQIQ